MTLNQLIAQLEVVRNEYGGQAQVVARRFGDHLESGATLHVETRHQLAWTGGRWVHDDCICADEAALRTATVIYLEH